MCIKIFMADLLRKTFIFTVGIPGSGKSTKFPNAEEADKFPNLYNNGILNKAHLKNAHKRCLENCIDKMKLNQRYVEQSNTNLYPENLILYLEKCIEFEYDVHIELPQHGYFFYDNNLLPKEQFDEMINRRSNIPSVDMIRMKNQFDKIIIFYKKMEKYNDPRVWLNCIKNPFFSANIFDVNIEGITIRDLNVINNNTTLQMYTIIESNEINMIKGEMNDESVFTGIKLIQTMNRSNNILIVRENDNIGYINLSNNQFDIDYFLDFIKFI